MIKNVFGKGGSTHGKHSSQLNVPSDHIDRRTNSAYRCSSTRTGTLNDDGTISWDDEQEGGE